MAGAVFLNRRVTKVVTVDHRKPKDPDLRPNPGTAFWGGISGNIKNQQDLMAAIQEAKDWAVVGWVL